MVKESVLSSLPKAVIFIDFADNIGVIIVAQAFKKVEVFINKAMFQIRFWLEDAKHKTEIIFIIKPKSHD